MFVPDLFESNKQECTGRTWTRAVIILRGPRSIWIRDLNAYFKFRFLWGGGAHISLGDLVWLDSWNLFRISYWTLIQTYSICISYCDRTNYTGRFNKFLPVFLGRVCPWNRMETHFVVAQKITQWGRVPDGSGNHFGCFFFLYITINFVFRCGRVYYNYTLNNYTIFFFGPAVILRDAATEWTVEESPPPRSRTVASFGLIKLCCVKLWRNRLFFIIFFFAFLF